ncbi:hypothetical protein [Mucilaginibacter sp. NFX135]|uniref:hypothetical protein n=1 Tax=Mucilaginibacter sp. NFX135 TaxID=3402687 RepID=UPI003AFB5B10
MYSDKPAPWDHYPKFLRFSEVQNPLNVIRDFYSYDFPKGHFKQLKKWRNLVITAKHYKNKMFGPENLLYIYELHVKLIEGLYLLLLAYQDAFPRPKMISVEQLDKEREEWSWFPDNLTKAELADPYIPVKAAFKKIKLQKFRDHLSIWIYAALTKGPVDESVSPADVITVYEHLNKLYASAWLINQRNREKPVLKMEYREENKTHPGNDDPEDSLKVVSDIASSPVQLSQTPAEKWGLKEVINLILKKEPMINAIVHIKTLQDPFTYFLYILIDNSRYFLNHKLSEQLERANAALVPVFIIMESARIAQRTNDQDRCFLDYVLSHGVIIYQADGFSIEKQKAGSSIADTDTKHTWASWKKISQPYFKSSHHYIRQQDYHMALYSLHQSLEISLLGLIQLRTGFQTTIPKFQRLIKMTLLFTEQINHFFETLAEGKPELYHLLWNVYPEEERQKLVIKETDAVQLTGMAENLFMIIENLAGDGI